MKDLLILLAVLAGSMPVALIITILICWLYLIVLWSLGKNNGYEFIDGKTGKRKNTNPFPEIGNIADGKINSHTFGLIGALIYLVVFMISYNAIL